MKKSVLFALVASVPLLLCVSAWQGGRYAAMVDEVEKLEKAQELWLEENKKLAGGIAVLESRERAARLAEDLGLEKAGPERRIIVKTAGSSPAAGKKGRSDG